MSGALRILKDIHQGAIALLLPIASFVALRALPGADGAWINTTFHFWAVGGTALASAVACAVILLSARTLRETRLLFLALAFLSIAGIFAVHGLMTPGFIKHEFHESLAVSAWFSVIAGAAFVALSAVDLPDRAERFVQRAGAVIAAWGVVAIAAYISISLTIEDWLDGAPTDDRRVQYAIAISATALFAIGAWRYTQAYVFARLPGQAAMAGALVLLVQVPPILLWGEVWYVSWWVYHAAYGAAFVVLFAGWALEVRRAGSLKAIADALAMRDALAALNRGRDRDVLELVDAIEAKDVATLGHVSRVSSYALAIGKRMNLAPQDLRDLVLAAQMHDVGKIGVPDALLAKRGALTHDEYEVIKQHARRGFEIAERVDALRPVARIVRAHHERLDGSGYPDGLRGDEIPLLARIVAVADTYDAMTSSRPYRAAIAHEEACAELLRVRGRTLDAGCVDALLAWFESEGLPRAA
jgi:HD-GYP domain-containing protein (c-di-GMP phosphodiesterase class II)